MRTKWRKTKYAPSRRRVRRLEEKLVEPATQYDVAEFFEKVAQAPKSALLLDYDGTLAPFRIERDKAVPYPGVTNMLQEILSTTRTQIFIVTGRKTDDIVSLLGVYPYPTIWGLHGTQRRNPNGAVEMTCVDEDLVQALMEADRWLQLQGLRHIAEYKPGSIAVHWRGRSESETRRFENWCSRDGYRLRAIEKWSCWSLTAALNCVRPNRTRAMPSAKY